MQDFRKIDAWTKAHSLVLAVYRETQSLPRDEVFGATIQLRRSAMAIPMKIAEGSGRDASIDFAADLRKAQASCNELEYLVLLARDLEFIKADVCDRLTLDTIEVRKMIHGLLKKL